MSYDFMSNLTHIVYHIFDICRKNQKSINGSKINVSVPRITMAHERNVFQYNECVQVCLNINIFILKIIIAIRIRRKLHKCVTEHS